MKIILPTSNFTFTPSLNQVNFSPMGGAFKRQNLYAVINITTGKLVYAVASVSSGFGGTFAGTVLTYSSSNVGQLASDTLQVIYDDETFTQNITGSVTIQDPANVQGPNGSANAVASAIHDGSGTFPILSTPDPLTLREGLDIHVQSASVQGLLNNPLPLPYQNQALSVGYINGGDLVAPKMNIGTNELIVDATQSGPVPVDITSAITLPVSAASLPLPSGASTDSTISTMSAKLPATLGQKTMANSMAVVLPSDQVVPVSQNESYTTGALTLSLANNIFNAVAGPNSTDALGFKSGAVQVVTSATTGALIFEHSNDNINYQPMPVFRTDSASPNAVVAQFTPAASSFVYHFPIKARYIRCRIATALNQNAQAFLRLSQESWAPIVPQVVNATAANLNATVSGSLTSAGTVSTVTTVTTVASVTSGNTGIPLLVVDVASSALTTTTTTGTLTPTNGVAYQVVIPVTATSGTGQTLDVSIEESDDSGTNWVRVYDFPRITAIGVYRSGPIKLRGNRVRYVQTVAGTTPSFTRSIQRLQRSDTIVSRLTMINRTIDPNTLNSTSTVLYCDGSSEFNYYIRCTAQTTPATIKIQFSDDNANWYSPASAILTTAVGFVKGQISDEYWRFARAIVTSAGSGITLAEFSLKGARE